MRKLLFLASFAVIYFASQVPVFAAVTGSRELPDGMQFDVDGGTLRVQLWSDEVVRVTFAAGAELPAIKSLTVVATPAR